MTSLDDDSSLHLVRSCSGCALGKSRKSRERKVCTITASIDNKWLSGTRTRVNRGEGRWMVSGWKLSGGTRMSLTPSYVAQPVPSKQDKHLGVTVWPKARVQRQEFAARANCDEKKLRAKAECFFFV